MEVLYSTCFERVRLTKLTCLICAVLLAVLVQAPGVAGFDDSANGDGAADRAGAISAIVVNEIHYEPRDKRAHVEFVELFNASSQRVDLSGWAFTDGIGYEFPAGTTLEPRRFLLVAADPARLQQHYGAAALGPFRGRLANEGDLLVLRDAQANIVDSVEYGIGFPWPIGGGDDDFSIGLVAVGLDNAIAGAWRAGRATPGSTNTFVTDNPPPFVESVEHLPARPTAFDTVQVQAKVTDADGVAEVWLWLQDVAPGNYIRLTDPAYAANWSAVPMQLVGPDLFAAEVPAYMRGHRHLIRYRIEASDRVGRRLTVPYWEDPQPNFALYIYNGAPGWAGMIRPGAIGAEGAWNLYDFGQMRQMPVYQLLAAGADVADAQHIPYSALAGYLGNDYPWLGTLVYDGVVYDHIGFRARGGFRRYATGKNNWKFNFRRGHWFQAYDNYGEPYPVQWDKLVFSSVLQHANRKYRGEQGMFETLSYRLFNLAGVPASNTHFVHFRVVDQPVEATGDQYTGDFWGLYLAIENVDGRFLDQHDLPDGNLYEMKGVTGEPDNEGETGVPDKSDLVAFMNHYLYGNPDPNWWRANLDLAGYFSYRSIVEAIHHYDIWEGKNYYYYLHPETRKWSVIPWDLDITWAETMSGTGLEPFVTRVLGHPEFQLEYQNRLREVRDLLFNPDQIFPLIDETVALIDTPANGLSMVDADRAMWDYNPILESDYIDEGRAGHGLFYLVAPNHDFRGMVQLIRDYAMSRANWIDIFLLTDYAHPYTPGLWYVGPQGYPADQLTFDASTFRDPQGDHTFGAMQWRAAELIYAGLPGYNPNQHSRYEIEATWQSAELTDFQNRITVPQDACRPGIICRVRVRMKDTSGRWSHWSAPLQFIAGQPAAPAPAHLLVSEIMYHPVPAGAIPSEQLEFIELRNAGGGAIDLSGAHFLSAIDYTFARGVRLEPGRYLVLAADAEAFARRYGFAPDGEYRQNLKNSGEQIVLADAFGRTLLDFTYGDDGVWPTSADGEGYSLVLRSLTSPVNLNEAGAWRASQGIGGSPATDDPEPILLNEVIFNRNTGRITQVELFNPSDRPAVVGNWLLTAEPLGDKWRWQSSPAGVRLPANAVIQPGGYFVVSIPSGQLTRSDGGQWQLSLLSSTVENRLTGYRASDAVQPPAVGVAAGRTLTSRGEAYFVPLQTATPGSTNAAPQVGPVVISRMMIVASAAAQWIELTNLTNQPARLYDPQHPERTWMITGALVKLPTGIVIPPHGRIWIAGGLPADLCAAAPPDVRVTGPFARPLTDSALHMRLLQPVGWGADRWVYGVADLVDSGAGWPLPGELNPILQRTPVDGFGPDPANWQAASAEPVAGVDHNAVFDGQLCLFEAVPGAAGATEVRWRVAHDASVRSYIIATSDETRSIPESVTIPADTSATAGQKVTYAWTDPAPQSTATRYYWLAAEHVDGSLQDLGFTNQRTDYRVLDLPLIMR